MISEVLGVIYCVVCIEVKNSNCTQVTQARCDHESTMQVQRKYNDDDVLLFEWRFCVRICVHDAFLSFPACK